MECNSGMQPSHKAHTHYTLTVHSLYTHCPLTIRSLSTHYSFTVCSLFGHFAGVSTARAEELATRYLCTLLSIRSYSVLKMVAGRYQESLGCLSGSMVSQNHKGRG